MNISIFISFLFGFQLLYWFIGRRASKKINNKEDYFLAGKSVRLIPLTMTFFATLVGGGLILGAADESYQFGWPVLLYPIGSALGFIMLGTGIGRKLAGFQVSTLAQIFEMVYRSAMLKRIASILSILSLFMILVAQIIASQKFLVSLGLSSTPLFIVFWAIIILYTAQGGLKAVISTDIAQGAFFSSLLLLCFGFVLYTDPSISSLQLPMLENFSAVSSKLWGWLLMPLLWLLIGQDMAQRCFAGASPKIVSKAALLAGLGTILVGIVPIFFGCLAKSTGLEISQGSSVLMAVIAKTTNPWITAIVGCAVLAAIISTATSIINAISSNLSNDFKLSAFSRIDSMRLVRGITCVVSISAIFFAFNFEDVIGLLIQSYELSVSCLFIPIFIALFKKKGNFLSALLSMLFGFMGFILFRIYPIEFPREVASILLSLLGYGCGEIIARYKSKKLAINQGSN